MTRGLANHRRAKVWKEAAVAEIKRQVKGELDDELNRGDEKTRLNLILKRIQELEATLDDDSLIKRFVYCMSALVHQEKWGGLTQTQVDRLVDMAHSILELQGIKEGHSRAAGFYSELYSVLSQIYRRVGLHFQSFWQQEMASSVAPTSPIGGIAFQSVALANRLLRRGHARGALAELEAMKGVASTAIIETRIRLERVHALRLMGDSSQARVEAQEALGFLNSSPALSDMKKDFEWEILCLDTQQDLDANRLVYAVSRRKPHYVAAYVLEAILWTKSLQRRAWLDAFAKADSLAQNASLKVHKQGFFFQSIKAIEQCYDSSIPLQLRMRQLGTILSKSHMLVTLDKELLLLAAAARWLSRVKAERMMAFIAAEYKARCLTLSDGQNTDTLGVIKDLVDKKDMNSGSGLQDIDEAV